MILKTKGEIKWDDEAIKFGLGLFETLLFRNNKLQFLNDHINRLMFSSNKLAIGSEHLEDAIKELKLIEATLADEQIIRVTLTNTGYCIESRLNPYSLDNYNKGKTLRVYPYKRGDSPILKHKTTAYIQNIIAKNESESLGFDDCVFTDYNENILETSIANLCFKKGNKVVMPDINGPLLEGIAQKNIESVFRFDFGFETSYEKLKLKEIVDYDEAFISNSAMQLMPIRFIDNHEYHVNTKLATKVNALLDDYHKNEMDYDKINDFITNHFADENDIKFIILTGSSRKKGFSKERDIDIFIIDTKSDNQQRDLVRYTGYDWDINILSQTLVEQMIRDKTGFLVKALKESTLIYGMEAEFDKYKKYLSL